MPFPETSQRERALTDRMELAEADFQVVPELFDGRYGTLIRSGAIIAIAVLLVLLVLGGLAMFSQLSLLMEK